MAGSDRRPGLPKQPGKPPEQAQAWTSTAGGEMPRARPSEDASVLNVPRSLLDEQRRRNLQQLQENQQQQARRASAIQAQPQAPSGPGATIPPIRDRSDAVSSHPARNQQTQRFEAFGHNLTFPDNLADLDSPTQFLNGGGGFPSINAPSSRGAVVVEIPDDDGTRVHLSHTQSSQTLLRNGQVFNTTSTPQSTIGSGLGRLPTLPPVTPPRQRRNQVLYDPTTPQSTRLHVEHGVLVGRHETSPPVDSRYHPIKPEFQVGDNVFIRNIGDDVEEQELADDNNNNIAPGQELNIDDEADRQWSRQHIARFAGRGTINEVIDGWQRPIEPGWYYGVDRRGQPDDPGRGDIHFYHEDRLVLDTQGSDSESEEHSQAQADVNGTAPDEHAAAQPPGEDSLPEASPAATQPFQTTVKSALREKQKVKKGRKSTVTPQQESQERANTATTATAEASKTTHKDGADAMDVDEAQKPEDEMDESPVKRKGRKPGKP